MSQQFAIHEVSPRAWLLPGFALAAATVGMLVVVFRGDYKVAWLFPVVLVAVGSIAFVLRRRSVSLENGTLSIAAGFNSRRVAIGEIDVDNARIVDLRERTELKPMLKVMGTGLPGYEAGHFRLRNRDKAFVMLTDRTRVLVLPEKSGRKLLLSLQQPQALLDALRRKAH